jgi:hypothetical protein
MDLESRKNTMRGQISDGRIQESSSEMNGFWTWLGSATLEKVCQEPLILEEITIFKDPFDLVDFQVHDIFRRLESGGQKAHEFVDIKILVGDNV